MKLPESYFKAVYKQESIESYKGNPFIEALPPTISSVKMLKEGIKGKVKIDFSDVFADSANRIHIISSLIDDFFQPLSSHVRLEEKLSIMIRQGYVGRNIEDGGLQRQLQRGYEQLMTGNVSCFSFTQAKSTARSLTLIGVSGCGKSTSIARIFSTYPQVIFHEKYNRIQVVYLKMECPSDGSLKSLCLNFFREVDAQIGSEYENKYRKGRDGVESLISLMAQISNQITLGILVIDEIQRLNLVKVGGKEKMLEFFVQLVNVVGIPVVFVGTPKARIIFEAELQSGRRSAGFGSIFWEPAKYKLGDFNKKSEWTSFCHSLWKYQWLQKKDDNLPNEIMDCLYDLSQGIFDVVVKLFVMAQLRAITIKTEKISVQLLKQVFEDDFKPIHDVISALRSQDPESILKYSDLQMPSVEKKLLLLDFKNELNSRKDKVTCPSVLLLNNSKAKNLYNMLVAMDLSGELLIPIVNTIVKENPDLTLRDFMPLALEIYEKQEEKKKETLKLQRQKKLTKKLNAEQVGASDMRRLHQRSSDLYQELKKINLIFNIQEWISI